MSTTAFPTAAPPRTLPPVSTAPAPAALDLEAHRRALTGYCYRMLGSGSEAEDAVQETMVRAWRSADRLQEPAALKAWLHRIASNVCFDMLRTPQRRAQPMDLGPAGGADGDLGRPLADAAWVTPIADARVVPEDADPAAIAELRETLRLAFVAALQHLPPRQRAVLVLCEVLRWQAAEVAELLETSVASVNSALQRARATLASLDLDASGIDARAGADEAVVERYVDCFERYDIPALVQLLREDVEFSMPPFPLWVRGRHDVQAFMLGPGAACEDSRVLRLRANGGPAIATYKREPGDTAYRPWAIVLLELEGEAIVGVRHFLALDGVGLFPQFGLPAELEA